MTKAQLEELKASLLKMKQEILDRGILTSKEDLQVSSEDLPDEADLASSVINQQVSFSMRQRETHKLKCIAEALARIEAGTYGQCEDCGDNIGFKRLMNQPFTDVCITHAEEREREQQRFQRIG